MKRKICRRDQCRWWVECSICRSGGMASPPSYVGATFWRWPNWRNTNSLASFFSPLVCKLAFVFYSDFLVVFLVIFLFGLWRLVIFMFLFPPTFVKWFFYFYIPILLSVYQRVSVKIYQVKHFWKVTRGSIFRD